MRTWVVERNPGLVEGDLDARPNRIRYACGDDEVLRGVVLQHQPHRTDVVAGVAPVTLSVEVAERQLVDQSEFYRGCVPGDLPGNELESASGALMVEEDPARGEQVIGLPIVDRDEVAVDLRDTIWRTADRTGSSPSAEPLEPSRTFHWRRLGRTSPRDIPHASPQASVSHRYRVNSAVSVGWVHDVATNDIAARL